MKYCPSCSREVVCLVSEEGTEMCPECARWFHPLNSMVKWGVVIFMIWIGLCLLAYWNW